MFLDIETLKTKIKKIKIKAETLIGTYGNDNEEAKQLLKDFNRKYVTLPMTASSFFKWQSDLTIKTLLTGLYTLGQENIVSASWACALSAVCFAGHHIYAAHKLRAHINELQIEYDRLIADTFELCNKAMEWQKSHLLTLKSEANKLQTQIATQNETIVDRESDISALRNEIIQLRAQIKSQREISALPLTPQ